MNSFNKDIESLAETIFRRNEENNFIYISLGGIDSSEQLFTVLCLLLSKGIFYFYGEGKNIESIPEPILKTILEKLHYAGIECIINILERPKDAPTGIYHVFNKTKNDIKEHSLHMIVNKLYVVRFALPYITHKKCKFRFLA